MNDDGYKGEIMVDASPVEVSEEYPNDSKGRPHVKNMSNRALLEEIVTTSRATRDLVEGFIADFAKNPMFGTLTRMFGGR